MEPTDQLASAQEDQQFHQYVGNQIPWFVHLMWVGYWILAIFYLTTFFLPMVQVEMVTPP